MSSYKLNIRGSQHDLREDYTIEEWMSLQKWDPTIEENWPRLLSEATGITMDQAKQIPLETMQVAIGLLMVTLNPSYSKLQEVVNRHNLIDFDSMTFGQFVDLEVMLSRDLRKTLDKMVEVLYNAKDVREWQVRAVWPAVQKYLVFRKQIYFSYKALFEINDVETDTVQEVTDQSHVWYDMIMVLADEKFLQIPQVVDRPLLEALNFIAWKKDQAIKMEQQLQKQKQQQRKR
jgi:hypothetical protein